MRLRARAVAMAAMMAFTGPVFFHGPAMAAGAAEARKFAAVGHAGDAARLGHRPRRSARTPIKHFIFLMQGGRTFDSYFGTYTGADGIPVDTCEQFVLGRPKDGCVKPFLWRAAQQLLHGTDMALVNEQYDHGRMDGFVAAYNSRGRDGTTAMGYYDAKQLPFYWAVAHSYVLFDHFFASAMYGTRANRSYWVAAAPPTSTQPGQGGQGRQLTIFDRLQAAGLSWRFYVQDYNPGQTYLTASPANPSTQTVRVPLLNYPRFVKNATWRSHIVSLGQFYRDLRAGTLPAVAYIASSPGANERSASTLAAGQTLVRTLVTQLMLSRFWSSSALMWSYDGSGGFYDNVAPPRAGSARLGFRVPALLVSAYARHGQVNHTILDYTSALAFIEHNWRLAPLTRRDATAANLDSAFNFTAKPRAPDIISATGQLGAGGPAQPTKPPAMAIYVSYGGALAFALMLVLLAVIRSARYARRPSGAGR